MSSEVPNSLKSDTIRWFNKNTPILSDVLEAKRQDKLAKSSPMHHFLFDLNRKTLSEMALCETLEKLDPPPGFLLDQGWVLYPEIPGVFKRMNTAGHFFWVNEDIRACITSGQFIYRELHGLKSGHRLQTIQRLAPDLIHFSDQGIAILLGTVGQIDDILKINYHASTK